MPLLPDNPPHLEPHEYEDIPECPGPRGLALYDHTDAKRVVDFFNNEFIDSLGILSQHIDTVDKRGRRTRRQFISRIFLTFWKLVIDDCIAHNHKFVAPCYPYFLLYIREMKPEHIAGILAHPGIYARVNKIKSDFKYYEFIFYSEHVGEQSRVKKTHTEYKGKKYHAYRSVRVNRETYQTLIDQVNNGRRYFQR